MFIFKGEKWKAKKGTPLQWKYHLKDDFHQLGVVARNIIPAFGRLREEEH